VPKKSSQQQGFYAAQGLCPANQAKPGLQTIALFLPLKANAWQNLLCPSNPAGQHRFALFHPKLFC